jgi:hypothetical protein
VHATASRSLGRRAWWSLSAAVAALTLTATALSAPAPASAAEPAPTPTTTDAFASISADDLRQGIADIKAAGIPYTATNGENGTFYVFHFPEGDFGIAEPPSAPATGTVTPQLYAGWDGDESYISFNQTDQIAIRNGATAALVLAITVLNPVVGSLAGVFVAFAGTYIANNGACPGNDELWIYYTQGLDGGPNYTQVICRPVSYPGGG